MCPRIPEVANKVYPDLKNTITGIYDDFLEASILYCKDVTPS